MKKLGSSIALSMVTMLLLSMMAIFPAYTQLTPEFYMEPSVNPPAPGPYIGFKWNVTVYVKDITDVYAWMVHLAYDPTLLNLTNIVIPPEEKALWGGMPVTFYGADYGEAADTLIGDVPGVTGAGPYALALFEFEILKAPQKYETLSCALNIDNDDTYLLDSATPPVTISPVTKTDGSYTWTWTEPETKPRMAVVPPYKELGMYDVWNSTNHAFDIVIQELDVEWALHNASFSLSYNSALVDIVSIVVDPLWTTNTVDTTTPGIITVFVGDPSTTPFGDVLVYTVTFHVKAQGMAPPREPGTYDDSDMIFSDVVLYDTAGTIPTRPAVDGRLRVFCKLELPLPWFKVVPDNVTLGPELVVGPQFGKEFDVNITITMHGQWSMIAWNLRLTYDKTLLDVVSVEEGPFLQDPRWNKYGTYFTSVLDGPNPDVPKENIAMGGLLFPDPATGDWERFPGLWNPALTVENTTATEPAHMILSQMWHELSPATSTMHHQDSYEDTDSDGLFSVGDRISLDDGVWYKIVAVTRPGGDHVILDLEQEPVIVEGTLATIRFRAIKQSWTEDYSCDLAIYPLFPDPDSYVIDKDMNPILVDEGSIVDGTYTVLKIAAAGRIIDAWIGEYPFPFGGQGVNEPADLVVPQQQISITVKVTYNWWPVGNKEVAIEIRDPQGRLVDLQKITTDEDGHAYKTIGMPWPSDPQQAEELLGKWTIYATADIGGEVTTDVLVFDYDYLVRIWSVETDKLEYAHLETVAVTVTYGTKAMQDYDVIMSAVIQDELEVPIGVALLSKTIGGAEFCTYKNYTDQVTILIPWWAYAGEATVRANFFNDLPSMGGVAVTPETTETIWILPI